MAFCFVVTPEKKVLGIFNILLGGDDAWLFEIFAWTLIGYTQHGTVSLCQLCLAYCLSHAGSWLFDIRITSC